MLLRLELKCDVLAITEHWLSDANLKCISLDKYILISCYCRKQSIHGGSCLYVRDSIKAVNIPELTDLSIELICEISAIHLIDFNLIIICLYRTNLVSVKVFLTHLERVLEKANEFGLDFIVVGDMNINCLGEQTIDLRNLEDILVSQNCRNEVTFPTRVSTNSSTALDHAYTNVTASVTASPIVTNIGDHRAVRIELAGQRRPPAIQTRVTRDYSLMNRTNFTLMVDSMDWANFVSDSNTAEVLTTKLCNMLSNLNEICFPLKKRACRKKTYTWITQDVLNTKSLLFDCLELQRKFPNNIELKNRIDCLNSKYNFEMQQCKMRFYVQQMTKTQNSSKAMWDVVNRERGKTVQLPLDFTELVENRDGVKYSSKKGATDAMNSRFVDAPIACGAPRADLDLVLTQLRGARAPANQSMRLPLFTAYEVHSIIATRIPHKSTKDIYGLSMDLLNSVAFSISPVLAHLFNACIRDGSYPRPLKTSKISPVFKGKGKRENMDNYRPVSIIPCLAKVLENGLCHRLTAFLSSSNALSERQYAYRAGRCTTDMVREAVRKVTNALENRQQVAMLCCDLSKAFDVADHNVIAAKLLHYGIRGRTHSLLTDILDGRSQIVVGDGGQVKSEPLATAMGVAQGSSVSNILFSLLLNDLPEAIPAADILMYADDVAGIISAPNVDSLEARLNEAANQLSQWFSINGLALNLTKTHFLHFHVGGREPRSLMVRAGGVGLEQVEATTFLGFKIDYKLTWATHIDQLCGKAGGACFALRRLARFVPRHVVRTSYFATVHSLLQYGAEIWGCAADWQRAFRIQKRAVRSVVQVAQDVSVRPYFKELGILTLPALVIAHIAVYTHTHLGEYKKRADSNRSLRDPSRLVPVKRRLAKSGKMTHVMGPTIYNKLPVKVTSAPSLPCFKTRLKAWLLEHTVYSIEEFININIAK